MYILAEQLDGARDATRLLRDYHAYLDSVVDVFPPGAFALARSDWYHDFSDHRCPHDSWLEEVSIREIGSGPRKAQAHRAATIVIRLLGAYHDGHIELRYDNVSQYDCQFRRSDVSTVAHGDWRYDEFRLSDDGRLIHEIEWSHMDETARWVIEAADVAYAWTPFGLPTPAPHDAEARR